MASSNPMVTQVPQVKLSGLHTRISIGFIEEEHRRCWGVSALRMDSMRASKCQDKFNIIEANLLFQNA